MVKSQSTMKRGLACGARSLLISLALVGLLGCQASETTASPREVVADTKLALPGDEPWTLLRTDARTSYSATELRNGSVLVCGGSNGTVSPNVTNCSQLSVDFNLLQPISRTFPLPDGRIGGTLTLLPSKRVLLAGGKDSSNKVRGALLSSPLDSWVDGQSFWEATEDLPNPRTLHTATPLGASVVLIGGEAGVQQVPTINVRSEQGVWSKIEVSGGLATRENHTATALNTNPPSVLVLGGYGPSGYLSSGFIFSLPNTITRIKDMPDARQGHTATLLDDGSVLVVGGEGGTGALAFLSTAWRYFPDDDRWENAGTVTARKFHAAASFGTGVLIAGGVSNEGLPSDLGPIVLRGLDDGIPSPNTVQRYNSKDKTWSAAPNLHRGRRDFQLLTLDTTHLLAIGGNAGPLLESSELFSGAASGQIPSSPNACVSGYVADGVCCDSACADPCHRCNDPKDPGACKEVTGPSPNERGCSNHLQCANGSCAAQCHASSECEAGFYCSERGACVAVKPLGSRCSADDQCPGGNPCVDGVCCESSCSGSCEACDSSGQCRPLAAGQLPREHHPACPAAKDHACAASCDGSNGDRCAFPGANAACGTAVCTSEGFFKPAGECNGGGVCVASRPPISCGRFACDENGCLDECTKNSECADGNSCQGGRCVAACNEQACLAQGYHCDAATNQCRTSCQKSETDCAGSYYCHPIQHQCVKSVEFPAASLPACSVGRPSTGSRASLFALAAVLCVGATRRMRRTSRRNVC